VGLKESTLPSNIKSSKRLTILFAMLAAPLAHGAATVTLQNTQGASFSIVTPGQSLLLRLHVTTDTPLTSLEGYITADVPNVLDVVGVDYVVGFDDPGGLLGLPFDTTATFGLLNTQVYIGSAHTAGATIAGSTDFATITLALPPSLAPGDYPVAPTQLSASDQSLNDITPTAGPAFHIIVNGMNDPPPDPNNGSQGTTNTGDSGSTSDSNSPASSDTGDNSAPVAAPACGLGFLEMTALSGFLLLFGSCIARRSSEYQP
jgi:hypothetical protein